MSHQDSEQGQQEPEVLPELEKVQEQVQVLEQGVQALRMEMAQAEEMVQVLVQGLEPEEHLAEVIELASVRRKVRG